MRRDGWRPDLPARSGPLYARLADALAADIADGRLIPGDHLPTQRALAAALGVDVTTVARAYAEAARRGLVEARVGAGTFVRGRGEAADAPARRRDLSDRTMNQPPEPEDPALRARMRATWAALGEDMTALLRYQPAGGSAEDKAAALRWLSRRGIEAQAETLFIAPSAHAAMLAALGDLASPGQTVACEAITYPGVRAIAQTLGLGLVGLPCDRDGVDPAAFAAAAARGEVAALYLNPTLRNPTTETMPAQRRAEIVEVARRHGVAIVEDDAYGFLVADAPPAIAMLAPELTFYVGGLSKCLGAGLRLAYLLAPSPRRLTGVAARLRAASVMASPLTASLATRWIETGVADEMLAALRAEIRARQRMAAATLDPACYATDPRGFHLWVRPPPPWTRGRIVDWMRGHALGAVASDAFCVGVEPPEAFRLCLGGAAGRAETQRALEALSEAFERPPNLLQDAL